MRVFPHTLHGRFLGGLALVMILMGVFFVVMLRVHTRELLVSEAREKANLMTAHTESIQQYVRGTLRPAVASVVGADDFIIEAMSTSFVTRHILSSLNIDSASFKYRRVAKNARNPDYEVNEEEKAILGRFRDQSGLTRLEHREGEGDDERLIVARPVYFTQDCLRCHGAPENAPAVLLDTYGAERGFWKQSGELAGLDMISVSMRSASGAVLESVTMFAVWFVAGMLLLFGAVQGFFNRLVVHNLRRVSHILRRLLVAESEGRDGEKSEGGKLVPPPEAPVEGQDDIEGMVRSIETVAEHLAAARRQLSEYARNLESMVRERTADLESVAAARKADVQLFITLLSGLNRSQEKHSLLQASLKLIAGHFEAKAAVYACGISSLDYAVWPPTADMRFLDAEMKARLADPGRLLTLEEPVLNEACWLLPVQSSGSTRGVLGLFWPGDSAPSSRRPSLALAFSRQLGIALDNLDALDTLLRQNSLLDSLVEGVPDPLILVEGAHSPILANTSARDLARALERGEAQDAPAATAFDAKHDVSFLLERLGLHSGLAAAQEREEPVHEERTLPNGRSFSLSLYPLATRGGALPRTIVHIRETTTEKHLMLQMRRSEKLAVVGQLAAGIAHEINNPLGVIRCYAELLSPLAGGQEADDIQVILHHVDRAQSVLRDLLDFSRPHSADIRECDLLEFLPALSELFKAKASSARVSMRLDLPPRLPSIRTDKGLLEQVLINLLLNALAAVPPEEGVITLGAEADADEKTVAVSVTDNGPGIDDADSGKIFDPFYTTKKSGTGLGLTVAFGMAREMGGTIEVRNCYDQGRRTGVTFTVVLPVSPVQDSEAEGRVPPAAKGGDPLWKPHTATT